MRSGSLKGFEATSWLACWRGRHAAEVVNRIQQEVARALGSPAINEKMLARVRYPVATRGTVSALIDSEHKKWAQVVKASGRVWIEAACDGHGAKGRARLQ